MVRLVFLTVLLLLATINDVNSSSSHRPRFGGRSGLSRYNFFRYMRALRMSLLARTPAPTTPPTPAPTTPPPTSPPTTPESIKSCSNIIYRVFANKEVKSEVISPVIDAESDAECRDFCSKDPGCLEVIKFEGIKCFLNKGLLSIDRRSNPVSCQDSCTQYDRYACRSYAVFNGTTCHLYSRTFTKLDFEASRGSVINVRDTAFCNI